MRLAGRLCKGIRHDPSAIQLLEVDLTSVSRTIATFTISILLPTITAVAAAATDGGDTCHEAEGDTSIAACTALISSGTIAGEELAKAYMSRGLAQQKERRYAEAVKDFDEAVRVDPKSSTAFNLRGNLYQAIGQYDRAIQDYQSAIQNRPNYTAAFFNLGRGRRFQGRA
jgi:tetratricopeptide (TPR) repeat protein